MNKSLTMTRTRSTLILILLVATASAGAWYYYAYPGAAMRMQIESSYGDVRVGGQAVSAGGEALRADGATITTGEDGLVSVRLEDGSIVQLARNSRLEVPHARRNRLRTRFDTELQLDRGEILRRVPHGDGVTRNADMATATASLGVRGTEFIVVEADLASAVSVIRGKVAVGDEAGVGTDLSENYGVKVTAAGLGDTEVLPAPPALSLPARGQAVGSAAVEFHWAAVDQAGAYLIEVAEDEAFSRLMTREYSEDTGITLPGLQHDAPLYWRVATRSDTGLLGRSSDPYVLHYKAHFEALNAAGHDRDRAAEVEDRIDAALYGYADDAQALKAAAWVKYVLGKHDEARAYYDRAVAADETDLEARIERARVAFWQGELELAEADYRAVLDVQDDDTDAQWGLAEVKHRQGDHEAALALLDAVLDRHPDHADAIRSKARVLEDQGDVDAAAKLRERI